jgi:AcrR family transcriptional regulator
MVDKRNTASQPSAKVRILDKARQLFAEHGFDGTSLQQVADAVGMRKPSLLYHFRSKEALRESVIEELLAHWQETLPRLLAESRYGPDRFANLFDALLSFFDEEPRRARLVTRAALDHPELMRRLLREQLRPWTILLSDTIDMGKASGQIRQDVDAEAWVMHMISMVIGAVAVGPVSSALMTREDGEATDWPREELVRIARTSLFAPTPLEADDG